MRGSWQTWKNLLDVLDKEKVAVMNPTSRMSEQVSLSPTHSPAPVPKTLATVLPKSFQFPHIFQHCSSPTPFSLNTLKLQLGGNLSVVDQQFQTRFSNPA